jgi:cytochrome c peroxidase
LAFTDGKARAEGSTGQLHSRSSMSLVNVGYLPALTWVSATLDSLEEQALVPMFGSDPVELGLKGKEEALLRRIGIEPVYQRLFPEAFPGERPSVQNIAKSLAAFQRSIVSARSAYDRYRYDGEEAALSEAAKRGEKIFFSSEKAGCFQCHGGWSFAGPLRFEGGPKALAELHDTGLGGAFRAPTLRNIAVTAPYMHDGRIATLEEAVDHYNEGGRGKAKSPILRKLGLTPAEKTDLIEFLRSLTDEELLRDRRWSDPWER